MKILFNLLILKILSIFLFGFIIYELNKGNLDIPIKYAIEYYLQLKGFDGEVTNLQINNNQIKIDSIHASKNNITFMLENVNIDYYFDINYKKSKFSLDAIIGKLSAVTQGNQEFLTGKVNFSYENYFVKRKSEFSSNFDDINYQDIFSGKNNQTNLKNGQVKIIQSDSKNKTQYSVDTNFNNENIFKIHGKIGNNISFSTIIENFPIALYKPIYYMYPKNNFMIFLSEFIKSGTIESGEFDVDLTEEAKIQGFAKISNLNLLYDNDLPPLTNMQIDISQKGMITEFKINKANSTDISLENGLILMDWKGHDDTILLVTAKAHGEAKALTDFIPSNIHKHLQDSNIDLTKITGNTDVDVKIEIPLKHESENIYDITANISNAGLAIFKNQIRIQQANFSGKYDGKTLQLNGNGKINDFASEINFYQNFKDHSAFDHKLNIITDLDANSPDKQNKKIGFITLQDGRAKLNFEYISINNEGKILLNSDLKNLDLYFDKLAIHKNKGEIANLVLKGDMQTGSKGTMNFNLKGSNALNVSGNININKNVTDIIFNNLNYGETKLSSKISTNDDLIDINIKGKMLDLSTANMLQFLQKERDSGATKMQLSVDQIKLKNNILLNNTQLKFECNKVKCYSGHIHASIGSQKLDALLTEEGDWENWSIKSTNAGALLQGIGIYDSMRSGTMSLIIKTSRKEVRAGEIIPVLNGKFKFERFILHNAPSLTKLVSVVSLPGFVRMISGNKDIIFSNMNGNFTFQDGVLNILASQATGPFFSFTMRGRVNTIKRNIELKGNVNPSLYGASAIIGSIPIIGKIFTGDKSRRGVLSAPYVIREPY